MASIWDLWPARLASDAYHAMMFPGQVYQSQTPVTTEQMIKPAADLAGLISGGSFLAPMERGALTMGRPSIDYLNARAALKPASGGTNYQKLGLKRTDLAPDSEMDPWDALNQKTASDWSMLGIKNDAMWDRIFQQFGVPRSTGGGLLEQFAPKPDEMDIPF